jgi:hypothetical protein
MRPRENKKKMNKKKEMKLIKKKTTIKKVIKILRFKYKKKRTMSQ